MFIWFKKTYQKGRTKEYCYLIYKYRVGKYVRNASIYLGNKEKLTDRYGSNIGNMLINREMPKSWVKKYMPELKRQEKEGRKRLS